ncbi:hypothetical protein BS78_04G108600 [Paspalum vaginatum]|nr:hypothetical protein BS78_04G108600 [Paspalum vaginatum]
MSTTTPAAAPSTTARSGGRKLGEEGRRGRRCGVEDTRDQGPDVLDTSGLDVGLGEHRIIRPRERRSRRGLGDPVSEHISHGTLTLPSHRSRSLGGKEHISRGALTLPSHREGCGEGGVRRSNPGGGDGSRWRWSGGGRRREYHSRGRWRLGGVSRPAHGRSRSPGGGSGGAGTRGRGGHGSGAARHRRGGEGRQV